jgi:hypothetical protein
VIAGFERGDAALDRAVLWPRSRELEQVDGIWNVDVLDTVRLDGAGEIVAAVGMVGAGTGCFVERAAARRFTIRKWWAIAERIVTACAVSFFCEQIKASLSEVARGADQLFV